ncbi:bifunctional UDP-N-acetylglucosamine diphosphorylase/glucosamine-1-phosphate N-acetyltransferase GlmU, partial [Dolichospermum sp. ST_con]|nr:bifunctional UDP-N-acetylglucosamine diphosphorylase/glucosamine-1-phosphate N-acetyltransferase GlmU [Dolichospermum sp. ST_con]
AGTRIGPYAHLRGHAKVGANCRIGNFVELKNTQLGDRTNVSHLSYLGDTTAGTQVNVGAGTITANYDGVKKHKTIIGDRTKTGSNSVLVAPITVGNDVYIAAGSTVTEDVPDDSLVIARSRQVVKPGWKMKTDS